MNQKQVIICTSFNWSLTFTLLCPLNLGVVWRQKISMISEPLTFIYNGRLCIKALLENMLIIPHFKAFNSFLYLSYPPPMYSWLHFTTIYLQYQLGNYYSTFITTECFVLQSRLSIPGQLIKKWHHGKLQAINLMLHVNISTLNWAEGWILWCNWIANNMMTTISKVVSET